MQNRVFEKLLGWAFILGPLLTLLASFIWVMGVGINPGMMAWGSYIEGIVGYFGFIVMTPVFLALAYHLGRYLPRYAAIIAVIALIGFAGGGVMNMSSRVVIHDFVQVGVTEPMLAQMVNNWEEGNSLGLILILTGPFGPISSIMLGIGFLVGKVSRVKGWLLILAGIIFMSGQLFQIAPEFGYPVGNVLWLIALTPMGLKIISGTGLEEQLEKSAHLSKEIDTRDNIRETN